MKSIENQSDSVKSSSEVQKLIIIHGIGGSFAGAVGRISELFDFRCWWENGVFFVPRRVGIVLRHLINHPDPDVYTCAFQKLVISRFLSVCTDSKQTKKHPADETAMRFQESRLLNDFESLGIPMSPGARNMRALHLKKEAEKELEPILKNIRQLNNLLIHKDGRFLTEEKARDVIREHTRLDDGSGDLVSLLESLRDMQETGGDLDTVASATFYAYWLRSSAKAANKPAPVYGRDYRFVFANYHEGFMHFLNIGPAKIFAADLPIGAFPTIEKDAELLFEKNITFARYEDHHPYTPEQRDMMQRLVDNKMMDFFDLSGPVQGEELNETELKCGADMVYLNTIKGEKWDCKGSRTLRQAAHGEDFVTNRTELGKLLTSLIKGGINKLELVQLLLDSFENDDALERLEAKGLADLSASWDLQFGEEKEALSENAFVISIKRPDNSIAEDGGKALGESSDMPEPVLAAKTDSEVVRILVALAVHSEPGKPKLTTGRAIEYYSRTVPDADYIFYCFGSSLMVARRLNQADLTFNLGQLMPEIGTEEDGGHAGAAVCRPEANPSYPKLLLGKVRSTNFKHFVRYLSSKLSSAGFGSGSIRNVSVRGKVKRRKGGKALVIVLIISVLAGILLVLANPRFRPAAVLETNKDFFPYIKVNQNAEEAEEVNE
ncbi:hypothetical protein H8D64_01765 [PVC group bacterium]|nr:hypothetical protein [PVC group bacterium]